MKNRRHFLKGTLLGATGALLLPKVFTASTSKKTNPHSQSGFPMVISTWNHGLPANDAVPSPGITSFNSCGIYSLSGASILQKMLKCA